MHSPSKPNLLTLLFTFTLTIFVLKSPINSLLLNMTTSGADPFANNTPELNDVKPNELDDSVSNPNIRLEGSYVTSDTWRLLPGKIDNALFKIKERMTSHVAAHADGPLSPADNPICMSIEMTDRPEFL